MTHIPGDRVSEGGDLRILISIFLGGDPTWTRFCIAFSLARTRTRDEEINVVLKDAR